MDYRINTPKDKEAVKSVIDKLPESVRYDVTIKRHRERRSLDQNCLYFLWLACIADETGHSKDDLHEYFKQQFLGFEQRAVLNKRVYLNPSTATLNMKQFSEYLDNIQVFANSELGILLPNPQDLEFNQFYERYKNEK